MNPVSPESTPTFGIFEATLTASSQYANPYKQLEPTAFLTRPDGATWRQRLFWDGGDSWQLRVSPDQSGTWQWTVESRDSGLNGASGEFTCTQARLQGAITVDPNHPYHFQYQDGTPCWFMGDTNWRAFATCDEKNLSRETVAHYAEVRAAQGFNYIHVDVMAAVGINDNEEQVFFDLIGEQLNPDYFQEMDARVRHMNEQGITVGLLPAWEKGSWGWDSFPSDDARLAYARYLVARYSAFNVAFIVAGEWNLRDRRHYDTFNRVGTVIMDEDPHNRMRGIHAGWRKTVEEFAAQTWCTFGDYQQIYHAPNGGEASAEERLALHTKLAVSRRNNKPVVNAEYGYYLREMAGDHDYQRHIEGVDKPHADNRTTFRRASWALAMSGGYFITGFGTTYCGGWRDAGPFNVDAAKNDELEEDLTRLKTFFTGFDWRQLEPHDGLLAFGDEGVGYCLGAPGRRYIIYAEQTLHLGFYPLEGRGAAALQGWTAVRWNPRTGDEEKVQLGERGGAVTLETPDKQDWLFQLTAPGKGKG